MAEDEIPLCGDPRSGSLPEPDAHLLDELREGDPAAGRRFVRDYYPGVYRYLHYLAGHRERAEDLTQETFLQAWRHLDQFQGRAPLRLWLHTIARREFLQAKRSQRDVCSLDDAAELSEPQTDAWIGEADLRVLLGQLPEEQQEVTLLYYLGGYSSSEIAQIILSRPFGYTRLRSDTPGQYRYELVQDLTINQLADTMRMRWRKEEDWLLQTATLRVDYSLPGWFQWGDPGTGFTPAL